MCEHCWIFETLHKLNVTEAKGVKHVSNTDVHQSAGEAKQKKLIFCTSRDNFLTYLFFKFLFVFRPILRTATTPYNFTEATRLPVTPTCRFRGRPNLWR